MSNPANIFALATPGLATTAFPPNSRYHGVGVTTQVLPDGSSRVHLQRRFIPQTSELDAVAHYRVRAAERADRLAARWLGDATRVWQLCDANGLDARALTDTPGRVLTVALPRSGGSTSGA